ncbi:unnamed protein product [Callosobruchus maculatus]|uniref:Dynein assembly factor 1, axonemal homolog n=1 Tax=Callosobruchus maculatus TaxID=64391 RepID=A0A653DWR1_CALMS|nr:unnamed protein product [Callosobruchus maculatus]
MNQLSYSKQFEKDFRRAKFEQMKWSNEEEVIRINRNRREDWYSKYELNFSEGFDMTLRKTVFGEYVDTFNWQQEQDSYLNENKLLITNYQMKHFTSKEKEKFEKNNMLFDDSLDLLIDTINKREIVEDGWLKRSLEGVRLLNFYVKRIDYGLKSFVNLQVLILVGNNIRDIEGCNLPRCLVFLELYNNFIQSIQNLVKKVPKSLLHLGLGRNRLNDGFTINVEIISVVNWTENGLE